MISGMSSFSSFSARSVRWLWVDLQKYKILFVSLILHHVDLSPGEAVTVPVAAPVLKQRNHQLRREKDILNIIRTWRMTLRFDWFDKE